MYWILQSGFFNDSAFAVLRQTLERFGLPYSVHRVVPRLGTLEPVAAPPTANVICLGAYSLRLTASANSWRPGVFDLGDFGFPAQLTHWGEYMLNARARVSPLRDAIVDRPSFVRPIEDNKAFAGRVFDAASFRDWRASVRARGASPGVFLNEDLPVQVCPVRTIYGEYRFWIIKGRIVCASTYKVGERVFYSDDVPSACFAFVEAMIAQWQPHQAFVIDVCSVPDDGDGWQGMKIVEINTINCSAFYAADIQKLVDAYETAFGNS